MKTTKILLALAGSSFLLNSPLFAQQNGKVTPPAAKPAAAVPVSPNGPAGVAAEVNGDKIPLVELNRILEAIKDYNPDLKADTPEAKTKLTTIRSKELDGMITDRLLLQEAKRRKIVLPPADIDETFNNHIAGLKKEFKQTDAQFLATLKESGKTMNDLKLAVIDELLINEVKLQLVSDVVVSNEDIAKYYRANLSLYTIPEQVQARRILLSVNPNSPKEEKERVKKRATALVAQLNGGADFATLAKNNSDDVNTRNSGGLDLFTKSPSPTPTPAEVAVFGAPVNKIIGPLETSAGIQIFKVEKKIPAVIATLPEVQKDVETKATVYREKAQARLMEAVANLRKAAVIKKYV